eukprot:510198-Rhodomonas_salina.2
MGGGGPAGGRQRSVRRGARGEGTRSPATAHAPTLRQTQTLPRRWDEANTRWKEEEEAEVEEAEEAEEAEKDSGGRYLGAEGAVEGGKRRAMQHVLLRGVWPPQQAPHRRRRRHHRALAPHKLPLAEPVHCHVCELVLRAPHAHHAPEQRRRAVLPRHR